MKPILDCFKEDIDTYDSEENKEFKEKFKSLGVVSKVLNSSVIMQECNCIDMDIYLQSLNYKTFEVTFKAEKDNYVKKKYGQYFIERPTLDKNMYLKKIHEIKYINAVQNFEVFLGTCYKVIYWYYPELLAQKDYEIYKNFKGKNKVYERESLLDRKTKSFIMNGDLTKSIDELYNLIDRSNAIPNECLDELKIICKNRNLIVHNLGIVNDLYLREIKNEKLRCDYKEGQYIFEGKENNDSITTYDGLDGFLQRVADVIVKDITDRFEVKE